MTPREQAEITSRMRQVLMTFQEVQVVYLGAHRKLKSQLPAEVNAFLNGPGLQLEAELRTSAKELMAAFTVFSAAGLVASGGDRHLVTEARRTLQQNLI